MAPFGRRAPPCRMRRMSGWERRGLRSNKRAMAPATCGDAIEEPESGACAPSMTRHSSPGQRPGGAPKALNDDLPGTASSLIAAATMAPGAEISGLLAPVAVGPAELK